MRERKRAPHAGHLPRGWQFSLISRVHWSVHLADTPFECYFTKVIPLTTFDDFREPPPPPSVFIFQANLSDPSSESFRSFQRSRLLGSQL